jgi:hypothetical protein
MRKDGVKEIDFSLKPGERTVTYHRHHGTGTGNNADIKALALSIPGKSNPDSFNRAVLCIDVVRKPLILWLQKYLAMNGSVIQVYTGLAHAKQHYRENERALKKCIPGTDHLSSYYQTYKEDGIITLKPFGKHLRGKPVGPAIDLVHTRFLLPVSSEKTCLQRERSVFIEREKLDAMRLHILLANLSTKADPVEDLVNGPVLPYISSLCRWENGCTNCRSLDTVIVDAEQNVRTCWNGQPVGKVGVPLPVIMENIKNIHRETEKKRACLDCSKNSICTKCIFPHPLAEGEYCHLRKYLDWSVEAVASTIRCLDRLKDM